MEMELIPQFQLSSGAAHRATQYDTKQNIRSPDRRKFIPESVKNTGKFPPSSTGRSSRDDRPSEPPTIAESGNTHLVRPCNAAKLWHRATGVIGSGAGRGQCCNGCEDAPQGR